MANSISLQYSTMSVPKTGTMSYYNKITHTGIDYSTLTCMRTSGSGNFWPTIVQQNGETYLKIDVSDPNNGSSDKTAYITVYGGNNNQYTADCTITQTITEPYFSNAPTTIGTVGWQGEQHTFHLICTGITSISRAVRTRNGISDDLQFTSTQTSNGFDVVVTIPQNTQYTDVSSSIYFVGISNTYTPPVQVNSTYWSMTQTALPTGSITFDSNNASYIHSYPISGNQYQFSTENMNNNSITLSYSGDIVYSRTPTLIWGDGNTGYIEFSNQSNPTSADRTLTLTLTGNDLGGTQRTASFTITQVAVDNDSYIRSVSITSSDPYPYQNATVTGRFYAQNVTDITLSRDSGDITVTGITVTPTSTLRLYEFTATLADNTSYSPISGIFSFSGTNTIQGSPFGSTIESSSTYGFNQKGKPGVITVSQDPYVMDASAGNSSLKYTKSGLQSNPTATLTGAINATVSLGNTTITFNKQYNDTWTELTGTLTLTGTDRNGDTVTTTATVKQSPDIQLTVSPSTQTLEYGENVATYTVTTNLSNIRVLQVTGQSAFVDSYSVDQNVVTVNTSDFDDLTTKTATIRIAGDTPINTTYWEDVTLTKNGPDGTITLDPTEVLILKSASSFDIDYSLTGISSNTLSVSTSGDISFGTATIASSAITVPFGANNTGNDITGTVTVTGTDYNGKTITATANVTQFATDYYLKLVPNTQIVEYEQSSATIEINALDVTVTNVNLSGRVSLVRNYYLSGNTITINLETLTVATTFDINVTVDGISNNGDNVSDTATLTVCGPDGYILTIPGNTSAHSVVEKNKTSGSQEFRFTYFGVKPQSIVCDADWATITSISPSVEQVTDYFGLNRVNVSYNAYTGVPTTWDAHRTCTVTVTGIDYKGKTVVGTGTIIQYALDPDMTINKVEETIDYDGYLDVEVTLTGPASIPEIRFPDTNVTWTYTWLGDWGNGIRRTNTVRLTPQINLGSRQKNFNITFVSATPVSPPNLWQYLTIHQEGRPASITLVPSSAVVNKNSGSIPFTIQVLNVDRSTLGYTVRGIQSSSAQFNSDKTEITYFYPANPDMDLRTGQLEVYGYDAERNLISTTANITQNGVEPEINATDIVIGHIQSRYTTFVGTKGIENLSAQFVGDVEVIDYYFTPATGGYNMIIETVDNLSFDIQRSVCTITGEVVTGQYTGETRSVAINVTKLAKDGVITLSPATQYVRKAGGSLTFNVTYGNIDLTTVTTSNGTFSADKSLLYVNVGSNSTSSDREIIVTVRGRDNNGKSTSGTATINQYGIDPHITVGTIGIPNTQQSITVFVATKWIENLAVSFAGDVVIDSYTLTPTTGGYNLTIITEDNLLDDPLYSTATFIGSITTEPGETLTTTAQVIKYGKEGKIYVDPAEFILKKAGGPIAVSLSYNNMDLSTVTASVGSFNSDKSELTYTVPTNPNATDRTITITISGLDANGISRSATVTITQYGTDPYITITPPAQTVRYDDSVATYTVSSYKVSNLVVSFTGSLVIDSYTLENSTLTINSEDNEEIMSIIELITITGISDNGETITANATLTKIGTGGGIVIDPAFTIAGNAGLLVIPYYTDRIQEDTIYAFVNGEIDVTNVAVHRAGKFVIIEYNANSESTDLVSTLTLTCYDEDDIPRTVTSTITQLTSTYSFSINPTTRTVGYQAGTVTNSVVSNNIGSITSFESYGDMDATYSFDGTSTITITTETNTDDYRKYGVVTLTGVANSGDIVTASGYILQNNEYWGDWGFEFLDSSQANVTVDGGGRKLFYDILSVNRSTGEHIPYYVSGFVLTGYWGTLPSVKYKEGLPYIVIPINTREETRDVVATFMQEYSYLQLQAHIHQEEGAIPDVHPIWEIDELTSPNGNFVEYHITNDGEIIYAGKAYKYPDEMKLVWSVNDSVSDYLGNGIYFTNGIHQIPEYAKDFFIKTSANAKYVKTFYNSWAYEHTDYWLSDPIDSTVDPRQWLPVSFLSTNHPLIDVGGRVYAALKENDGWTVMTNLKNFALDCEAGITATGISNTTISYKVGSGDYVLYYSNAYGGWDSLLVTGTAKKTDSIEHLTYKKRSNSIYKFSKINYQNNITPNWTLKTGVTIDGNKMYHLLESTMVYLHNLETNEIIPVTVTNSQCEYLTYRNNGKKPYFYTITVEESNTKLRK